MKPTVKNSNKEKKKIHFIRLVKMDVAFMLVKHRPSFSLMHDKSGYKVLVAFILQSKAYSKRA